MSAKFVQSCQQQLGRTISKLMRGWEAGKVQKKIFAQGKLKFKKIHARQLTLKNIHAMA